MCTRASDIGRPAVEQMLAIVRSHVDEGCVVEDKA